MADPEQISRTISTQTAVLGKEAEIFGDKALNKKLIKKSPFKAISDSPYHYSIRNNMPARISVSKLPVVKLKEVTTDGSTGGGGSTSVTGVKRCHTIAEFNNLRNNYKNYCHYRRNGAESSDKQFPSLQDNSNQNDSLVLRASSKLSGRSAQSRPNTPKDNGQYVTGISGANGPQDNSQVSKHPCSPKKQVIIVDGISGYEVRGTTLGRGSMSAKTDLVPKAFIEENLPAEDRGKRRAGGVTDPRPTSGLDDETIHFSSRTLIKYYTGLDDTIQDQSPNACAAGAFDTINQRSLHVDSPSKALRRRVTFKGEDSGLVTSYTITPQTDESLRIGLVQPPLLLTEKNLQMFNRLSERAGPVKKHTDEETPGGPDTVNQRVLDWVKARSRANMEEEVRFSGPTKMDDELIQRIHSKKGGEIVHRIPVVEQEEDATEGQRDNQDDE